MTKRGEGGASLRRIKYLKLTLGKLPGDALASRRLPNKRRSELSTDRQLVCLVSRLLQPHSVLFISQRVF